MTRLSSDRALLADAVKIAGVAVAPKSSVPVLGGVLCEAAKGSLSLTAFDMDSLAVARIPCVDQESGTFLVSYRLLSQVVSVAPAGDLTIETEGSTVVIRAKRAVWRLPTMNADDWPRLPKLGEEIAALDAQTFASAVERVAVSAAVDNTQNQQLDCMQIRATEDKALTIAATDRYRGDVMPIEYDSMTADWECRLPARRLLAIAKLLKDGPLTLHSDGGMFGVAAGDTTLLTRMADMSTPHKVETISKALAYVLKSAVAEFVVNREALTSAVRQVVGLADSEVKGHRALLLTLQDGLISLAAGDAANGNGTAEVECEQSGRSLRVQVNGEYLLDSLGVGTDDTVRLSFIHPSKPIGVTDGDHPLMRVLMPVTHPDAQWLDAE